MSERIELEQRGHTWDDIFTMESRLQNEGVSPFQIDVEGGSIVITFHKPDQDEAVRRALKQWLDA